jgi:hypothetical protein
LRSWLGKTGEERWLRVEKVLLRRREAKVEVAAVREEKFGVVRWKTGWVRAGQEHWAG